MTLQSRPSKRLHLEISDFDTVALKFWLDPFPTQFDPLNKNMKSNFRNHARILRYMEITIIGVSEAHFRAFLGSFQQTIQYYPKFKIMKDKEGGKEGTMSTQFLHLCAVHRFGFGH